MSLDSMLYEVEAFREEMEEYVDEMGSRKGLSLSTPEDVLKYVEEHGVSSIRIWFTDMIGFLKSFSITPHELKGAFEEGGVPPSVEPLFMLDPEPSGVQRAVAF